MRNWMLGATMGAMLLGGGGGKQRGIDESGPFTEPGRGMLAMGRRGAPEVALEGERIIATPVTRSPRYALFAQAAPVSEIDPRNSGYPIERSACLAIALGANAATECGNLRVTHALPAVRVFNTTVQPTLIYNSEFAHPYPLVPVFIKQLMTTDQPQSVEVKVSIGTYGQPLTTRATQTWPGTGWPAGQTTTRRVTVSWDGLADTTGYYYYTVEVTNIYAGGVRMPAALRDGKMFIINRSQSPFGAGWWLAGLEQLKNLNQQEKVWIGGDGSARFFLNWGGNTSYAPLYDRKDSLVYYPGTSTWKRWTPEGRRVEFNSQGQHISTVNRFGRTTSFAYSGALLNAITLPAPTGMSYSFAYTASKLTSVTAPPASPARVTSVANVAGNVTSITNPGEPAVQFAYKPGGADLYLMDTRTDRLGIPTTFGYDGARRAASSSVTPGYGAGVITLSLVHGETRGLAGSAPVDTTRVYTWIDGPRSVADTTVVFSQRFGHPRKTVDAVGALTRARHDGCGGQDLDCNWVVFRVDEPLGRKVLAEYDIYAAGRGQLERLISSRDTSLSLTDTTRFERDQSFDQLMKVVPPERDSSVFGVNVTNGRIEWQQDARGPISRVNFYYDPAYAEQVTSVVLPAVAGLTATHTYTYHGTLRNLLSATTPAGYLTSNTYDGLGRVTKVSSPIEANVSSTQRLERRSGYDLRDLVVAETTTTINVSPVKTIYVQNGHDNEGQLTSVFRWGVPNPMVGTLGNQYRYDNAGRRRAEVAPNGQRDSFVVDQSGNVTRHVTRRGHNIDMTWDVANRLTQRIVPEITQADQFGVFPAGIPPHAAPRFPYFHQPLAGGGYQSGLRIFADTASMTYDLMGRVLTAKNRDAIVKRSWYANGLLKTDTLKIAVYDRVETPTGTPYASHVYGMTSTYDRNGRRVTRSDPSNLGGGQQTWAFHGFGALQTMTDRALSTGTITTTFAFDERGRPSSRTVAGGNVSESWTYDGDDRLTYRLDHVLDETYLYDGRAKLTDVTITSGQPGLGETVTNEYDGLGGLSRATSSKGSGLDDGYTPDPFGNIHRKDQLNGSVHSTYTHDQSTGGVHFIGEDTLPGAAPGLPPSDVDVDTSYIGYDAGGNQTGVLKRTWRWTTGWGSGQTTWQMPGSEWSWQAYGADGRLRVSQRTFYPGPGTPKVAFVEYRYDALGRKVLQRTQADSTCTNPEPECLAAMERFVWDGDQLVVEQRAKLPYTTHGWALETEETSGNFHGRLRYAAGPELDRPILLWKDDGATFTLVPHWSFRGFAVSGSEAATGAPASGIAWPGQDRGAYFGPETRVPPTVPTHWLGSLPEGQTDATGLLYRRHRYFNPATAQFTQEDPIGLAGGLNLYGFANGDPVNFSDPFGLCPKDQGGDGKTRVLSDCPQGTKGWNTYSSGAALAVDDPFFLVFGGLEVRGAKATATSVGAGIARGHAFVKHVLERGEFAGLGIRTRAQLGKFIDDIVAKASSADVKSLSRGRTAYWDAETGSVVIHDARSADLGTVFRPRTGRTFFEGLR